jgi:hypothetical protein
VALSAHGNSYRSLICKARFVRANIECNVCDTGLAGHCFVKNNLTNYVYPLGCVDWKACI